MADYTNYVRMALLSIEQTVKRDWTSIWTVAHPFYRAMAYYGTNFNKNIPIDGTKMLIPLATADQAYPAAGVTVANELNAMTANTFTGAFQAEYQFAHYRSNIVLRYSDKKILMSNEKRGALLPYLKTQLLNSFKNVLSTDIVTATSAPTGTNTADMLDAVPSLRYILSNANVVGGKDQALDTNWQARYNTATGPFSLDYVDDDMDAVNAKDRGSIDIFMASNNSSGNVYGKFRAAISPGERYENTDFTRKTGLNNFVYRGAPVVMDNRLAAGELIGLASNSWYVHLPEEPDITVEGGMQLTDATYQVYSLIAGIGCGDIGINIRRTGIT